MGEAYVPRHRLEDFDVSVEQFSPSHKYDEEREEAYKTIQGKTDSNSQPYMSVDRAMDILAGRRPSDVSAEEKDDERG